LVAAAKDCLVVAEQVDAFIVESRQAHELTTMWRDMPRQFGLAANCRRRARVHALHRQEDLEEFGAGFSENASRALSLFRRAGINAMATLVWQKRD
jgi:hypothetical protein